jgi:hypothetical protein
MKHQFILKFQVMVTSIYIDDKHSFNCKLLILKINLKTDLQGLRNVQNILWREKWSTWFRRTQVTDFKSLIMSLIWIKLHFHMRNVRMNNPFKNSNRTVFQRILDPLVVIYRCQEARKIKIIQISCQYGRPSSFSVIIGEFSIIYETDD